jgi:hypothetical protein
MNQYLLFVDWAVVEGLVGPVQDFGVGETMLIVQEFG